MSTANRASSRWQVLGRRTADSDWQFVGEVHAPDADMALLLAKEAFFRHGEGVDFTVCRGDERASFGKPDWLAFHTDKSYKLQSGYPLGPKRRRAQARVRGLGAVIDRPRPSGRGVVHPPTDDAGSEAAGPLPTDQPPR